MNNCITCKNICEKAGKNAYACKKFVPIQPLTIKTPNLCSTPKRIIVEHSQTKQQIEFVPTSSIL